MRFQTGKILFIMRVFPVAICFSYSLFKAEAFPAILSETDSSKQHRMIVSEVVYHYGWVLPTNSFIKGHNMNHAQIRYFHTTALQITNQTKGNKLWEQLYNYPRYGMGISTSAFINAPYLGNPIELYTNLSIPIFRWNNFSFRTDIDLGIAFNWVTYREDNYNIAIGSEATMYFNEGISLEYASNKGFFINIGAGLTHFSNGTLKVPNKGINAVAPRIGAGYQFGVKPVDFMKKEIPVFRKKSDLSMSVFYALRNEYYFGDDVDSVTKAKGCYYSVFGISASFNRQVGHRSKFGAGFMADYWGFPNSYTTVENGILVTHPGSFISGLEISIFPSYELIINKFAIVLQPSFYLYRSEYPFRTPDFYQRIGFKLDILKNLSAAGFLRVHSFQIADFIEWTLIYRLNL